MTIVTKEVAFVKTTGEAVMVMEYPDSEGRATVRRPVQGQDGISHITQQFEYYELESLEEQKARFFAEREEVLNKYGTKPTETPTDSKSFLA